MVPKSITIPIRSIKGYASHDAGTTFDFLLFSSPADSLLSYLRSFSLHFIRTLDLVESFTYMSDYFYKGTNFLSSHSNAASIGSVFKFFGSPDHHHRNCLVSPSSTRCTGQFQGPGMMTAIEICLGLRCSAFVRRLGLLSSVNDQLVFDHNTGVGIWLAAVRNQLTYTDLGFLLLPFLPVLE